MVQYKCCSRVLESEPAVKYVTEKESNSSSVEIARIRKTLTELKKII